jgi:hypothetical protein
MRPELKQMLQNVGKWRDPPPAAQDASASAPASASASATAASTASSSP